MWIGNLLISARYCVINIGVIDIKGELLVNHVFDVIVNSEMSFSLLLLLL